MTKIEKVVSYKQKVYERLKEDIITGKIKQGEVLNERKLSDDLGISRTPIREALQVLEAEGWVVVEPWKGVHVKKFTIKDVEDVLNVRRALEVLTVESTIHNLNDYDIKKLQSMLEEQDKLREKYDADLFICIDRKFHGLISELANNSVLTTMLNIISDKVRCLGIKALHTHERYIETLKEHTDILESIKNRDIDGAKQAMEYHMIQTSKNIYKLYKEDLNE
ncbi:MAG: DNA-binding GntR family transcriptional regulator [Clostridium sp.]|jgi:DNA-binding GntR family transcriptional regulator